uniref:(northern house mosquito) hypothetical protein n=1 Tax=Culex pipiens TaxID=7175 RepID=A0A8D8D8F9_CULPI
MGPSHRRRSLDSVEAVDGTAAGSRSASVFPELLRRCDVHVGRESRAAHLQRRERAGLRLCGVSTRGHRRPSSLQSRHGAIEGGAAETTINSTTGVDGGVHGSAHEPADPRNSHAADRPYRFLDRLEDRPCVAARRSLQVQAVRRLSGRGDSGADETGRLEMGAFQEEHRGRSHEVGTWTATAERFGMAERSGDTVRAG